MCSESYVQQEEKLKVKYRAKEFLKCRNLEIMKRQEINQTGGNCHHRHIKDYQLKKKK
jgi:hypothetical protein